MPPYISFECAWGTGFADGLSFEESRYLLRPPVTLSETHLRALLQEVDRALREYGRPVTKRKRILSFAFVFIALIVVLVIPSIIGFVIVQDNIQENFAEVSVSMCLLFLIAATFVYIASKRYKAAVELAFTQFSEELYSWNTNTLEPNFLQAALHLAPYASNSKPASRRSFSKPLGLTFLLGPFGSLPPSPSIHSLSSDTSPTPHVHFVSAESESLLAPSPSLLPTYYSAPPEPYVLAQPNFTSYGATAEGAGSHSPLPFREHR